jgi:hypothetical protein
LTAFSHHQIWSNRVDEKSAQPMDKLEAELRKPVQSGKARKADAVVPVGMA